MTPLEINKRIAELKGIKIYEETTPPDSQATSILYEGDSGHVVYEVDWVRRINDAWELFEELGHGQVISVNHDNSYRVGFTQNNAVHFCGADTATIAICLAWIKWKESIDNKNNP